MLERATRAANAADAAELRARAAERRVVELERELQHERVQRAVRAASLESSAASARVEHQNQIDELRARLVALQAAHDSLSRRASRALDEAHQRARVAEEETTRVREELRVALATATRAREDRARAEVLAQRARADAARVRRVAESEIGSLERVFGLSSST